MRLLALAVLAACGDDAALRFVVEHPAGITVDRTTVTVYESDSLHCADIAFSRLGPTELDAVLVAEQTHNADGSESGELTGISRTDHKVIVARGYANDAWLTAGCVESDEVDGVVKLTIATVPTVTAAIVLDVDSSDPLLAVIAATDVRGKSVANRRVSWTVYGPAGSEPMAASTITQLGDGIWEPALPSCTASSGAAQVHPIPPSVIGGYAVQLRAEWATALPSLYSRLNANLGLQNLAPPATSQKYCALRSKGTLRRLVCLDAGFARDYELVVNGANVTLVQRDMTAYGSEALAVISIANGADRDVYLVSSRGVLFPLFGAPAATNANPPCGDGTCAVDDIISVPPCGTLPGRLLVHTTGVGAPLRLLDARGGNSTNVPTGNLAPTAVIQLDNAGCVTRVDPSGGAPTLRQVLTYHVGTPNLAGEFVALSTRAVYNCGATSCMGNELLPGAGVAFTTETEPRMVITSVDATGVVLAQVVMGPDAPNRDLFVERTRLPAAGPPSRLTVGQFDTDGATDLFWSIDARRGTTFEVAYARLIGDRPLEAISAIQMIDVGAILTGDLSGEGRDDIVITGQAGTLQGVLVVPMHLAATPIAIPSDDTCAP